MMLIWRLASLGGLAVLALLAVVVLTGSSARPSVLLQHDFFFSDSGAVGRVEALASAEASQGKGGGGVKALLKTVLNKQVSDREMHNREGQRYANALRAGGLNMDPAAEKTIMKAVAHSKRGASSLAISNTLQKQVVLAGAIKGTQHHERAPARAHIAAGKATDKLRLAEAIMSGTSGPTGGRQFVRQVKEGVTHPKDKHAALTKKKASFKSQMKAQLAQKTAMMEKKGLQASAHSHQAQTIKPLKGNFAKSMMAQLNSKEAHLAKKAWHSQVKAVTKQDLSTASWDSAKQDEEKGEGVDTTLYSNRPHKPELTVGSASDDTQISVSDGASTDRARLEKEMERELNSKADSIQRTNFNSIAAASMPKKDAHQETDLVSNEAKQSASDSEMSRSQLEQKLEGSIHNIDHSREEALYHAGLVKEKFDGAVES